MGAIFEAGDWKAALAYNRKALDLIVQLGAADPNTIVIQDNRGILEWRLGTILAARGELAEGISRLRTSVAIARALLERQPNRMEFRNEFLSFEADLALALARSHDRAAVDALAAEAVPSLEWYRKSPVSNALRTRRPRTFFAFGEAYSLLKDRAQACEWFRQSVDAWHEIETSSGVPAMFRSQEADARRKRLLRR
jgi:tetratricopeptide (TPR) repeat protein